MAELAHTRAGARVVPARSTSADSAGVIQVLCNAADYAVDLQIEQETETAAIAVVGQVVKQTASSEPVGCAGVRLMARNRLLAESRANGRGEFCLVAKIQNGLKLFVDIEGAGLRMGIPLDRLTARFRL